MWKILQWKDCSVFTEHLLSGLNSSQQQWKSDKGVKNSPSPLTVEIVL